MQKFSPVYNNKKYGVFCTIKWRDVSIRLHYVKNET